MDRAASERFHDAPLVLISIDTLRSDRLPIYGYAQGATPAIDALRRDAILVERAYTHVPLTLPAHASIFTGLLPTEHGVRDNLGYEIAASTATLAEASRRRRLRHRRRGVGGDPPPLERHRRRASRSGTSPAPGRT